VAAQPSAPVQQQAVSDQRPVRKRAGGQKAPGKTESANVSAKKKAPANPANPVKKKAPAKVPDAGTPAVVTDTQATLDAEDGVARRIVRARTRRPIVADPFTVTVVQPPADPQWRDGQPAVGHTTHTAAEPADAEVVLRRRRSRSARARTSAELTTAAAAEIDATCAEPGPPATEVQKSARTRRRARGYRGDQDSAQARSGEAGGGRAAPKPDPKGVAGSAEASPDTPAGPDALGTDDTPAPTRLQARSRRGGRPPVRGVRGRGGRRVLGGVSEETRRAITEGPPRRMLVSVGEERTQIAVLEERILVEHYVTHRKETSYVGNVYLGRVQNVLPGMEAAFIDIGKGRNGVLYAGEVNYDESDLDGDLPRIEQTLRPGQTVLVQVTKDPMGTKGARLTQHLSIAGRFCVLAPGDGMLGISRKLTDEERERLRKILKTIKPEEYGLIVRTAAEGATAEQLEADVARLVRIWEQVRQRAEQAKPLEAVYEEPDLVIRVIRDVFGPEFTELVVDSEVLAGQVRDYLQDVSPELVARVSVYSGEQNILDAYEVTNQIRRALEKKVWLKSGGYLIVEKTEAMWIIDVNTGKFVGDRNLEETVLKNNIEAAVEIARQLRLRDMGGIIVIDFVDMLLPANREEVLKRFKRELARDKTKSRVMEISKLGLVQMTRKNVSQGLQESFMTRCDECEGRGQRMIVDILT
jgi:ribonuclease E